MGACDPQPDSDPQGRAEDRGVCPEHGIPDCSPLLNGCGRLTEDPDRVEVREAARRLVSTWPKIPAHIKVQLADLLRME